MTTHYARSGESRLCGAQPSPFDTDSPRLVETTCPVCIRILHSGESSTPLHDSPRVTDPAEFLRGAEFRKHEGIVSHEELTRACPTVALNPRDPLADLDPADRRILLRKLRPDQDAATGYTADEALRIESLIARLSKGA